MRVVVVDVVRGLSGPRMTEVCDLGYLGDVKARDVCPGTPCSWRRAALDNRPLNLQHWSQMSPHITQPQPIPRTATTDTPARPAN